MGQPSLQRRVARAADDVLREQGYVAFTTSSRGSGGFIR